jgi:lysophospholipase L1-like esterase
MTACFKGNLVLLVEIKWYACILSTRFKRRLYAGEGFDIMSIQFTGVHLPIFFKCRDKAMKKKILVRFLIQCLILIILLELFLRIIFYQQKGREGLAIVETAKNIKRKIIVPGQAGQDRIYADFLLVRPDSGKEVNKLIAEEALASNRFEYSPWADYKNIDFSGKYINTKGFVRATVPGEFINPDTTAVQIIYFFGGSTMYGVNATDRETIASAFVNVYKAQFPRGVSVKVVNYGVPAYYSYSELILLSHLVYSGKKPGIAIVLDGLNDFLMPAAALKKLPYFFYRLKMASIDNFNLKELAQIPDSTNTLFDYPDAFSEDMLADTLTKNYLSNIDQVKKMAVSNNFDAFFFIQPNPFFNYPNKKNDPVCDSNLAPLVEKAYAVLEKKAAGIDHCFFLGNMLSNEKGYPFIDRFHYSPSMCRKIAQEIVTVVGEKINKPSSGK